MKVSHALICFIFLTLQDGTTGHVSTTIHISAQTGGGNITASNTSKLSDAFSASSTPTMTTLSLSSSSGSSTPSSASFERPKNIRRHHKGFSLNFFIYVTVALVVVLLSVVLLVICKNEANFSYGVTGRRNSSYCQTEIVFHEKHPPASTSEDSIYQNLDQASMEPDHTYATLTDTSDNSQTYVNEHPCHFSVNSDNGISLPITRQGKYN